MTKEYLEAFKNLKQELYYSPNQIPDIDKWHEIIEEALLRLKAIDDANPDFNEVFECFKNVENRCKNDYEYCVDCYDYEKELATIKQTLIKAQELKSENNALLEENNDLYAELTFANKQYKELMEFTKQYKKVLEIIKEKKVDIELLEFCEDSYEYNTHFPFIEVYHLTEEEFELLKRWVK